MLLLRPTLLPRAKSKTLHSPEPKLFRALRRSDLDAILEWSIAQLSRFMLRELLGVKAGADAAEYDTLRGDFDLEITDTAVQTLHDTVADSLA